VRIVAISETAGFRRYRHAFSIYFDAWQFVNRYFRPGAAKQNGLQTKYVPDPELISLNWHTGCRGKVISDRLTNLSVLMDNKEETSSASLSPKTSIGPGRLF